MNSSATFFLLLDPQRHLRLHFQNAPNANFPSGGQWPKSISRMRALHENWMTHSTSLDNISPQLRSLLPNMFAACPGRTQRLHLQTAPKANFRSDEQWPKSISRMRALHENWMTQSTSLDIISPQLRSQHAACPDRTQLRKLQQ